jgi:hypothetical protein
VSPDPVSSLSAVSAVSDDSVEARLAALSVKGVLAPSGRQPPSYAKIVRRD